MGKGEEMICAVGVCGQVEEKEVKGRTEFEKCRGCPGMMGERVERKDDVRSGGGGGVVERVG